MIILPVLQLFFSFTYLGKIFLLTFVFGLLHSLFWRS